MSLLNVLDPLLGSSSTMPAATSSAPPATTNSSPMYAAAESAPVTATVSNLLGQSTASRGDTSTVSSANAQSAATYDKNAGTDVGLGPTAQDARTTGYSTALRTVQNLTKMTKAYSDAANRADGGAASASVGGALGPNGFYASLFVDAKNKPSQLGLNSSVASSLGSPGMGSTSAGQLTQSMAVLSASTPAGGSVAGPTVINSAGSTPSQALKVNAVGKA